ncbi:hypothetical protein KUV23_06035 [Algoriphagus marincola]|uniref:Uncharacterized protein n=1 Tax=Algoriphagus marincola TaxID=264027 RepID=A0ABS7N2G2_9BACT|nr:hypothetical protein [Algoriphagus marincola]MBY5950523.1 hypothetical protein [Algoriphagus marincola]
MFLGAIFMMDFGGFEFKVSFECKEELDSDTGIRIAKVFNIQVQDESDTVVNDWVDLDAVEKVCIERAIVALSVEEPPSLGSGCFN